MRYVTLILLLASVCYAQDEDTVRMLNDVVVTAYAHDKPVSEVPAAIAVIKPTDLERFGNNNLLPAVNTQPGVRMEERSPGSYRLSIRGSTLRSPFGIRNVKVYWNGIPLTDHSGNTYLNLLDFGNVDNIEIIKGPGSSLYGAGTGGVVLLKTKSLNHQEANAELTGGSFGLLRYRAGISVGSKNFRIGASYARQQADGYRDQAAMHRDIFNLNSAIFLSGKSSLSFNGFYSSLYYQTPGGLTKAQYDSDPSQARPAAGPNPSAEAQKAAIYNHTFFGGLTYNYDWTSELNTSITVFGNATDFKNPSIRNYEKRKEKMSGVRAVTSYKMENARVTGGFEYQPGSSHIVVATNNQGAFGTVTSDLKFPSSIFLVFAQYDLQLQQNLFLTAGFSVNKLATKVENNSSTLIRNFKAIFSPRVALMKKWSRSFTSYLSYSRGYSPPTTAELFPSTAVYDSTLLPEIGNNFEIGLKGNWDFFQPSLTLYTFYLNQTIVGRQDNSGADYFANAGKTSQQGVELLVRLGKQSVGSAPSFTGWISYSYNHYRFKDYYAADFSNYSDNALTGAAPNTASVGLDFTFNGIYLNATANYVDRIPLNDANTAYADEYYLLGMRAGYRFGKQNKFEAFGGVDNLLDQKYSLGNDLNAVAGRYYNSAATRNFYAGFKCNFAFK